MHLELTLESVGLRTSIETKSGVLVLRKEQNQRVNSFRTLSLGGDEIAAPKKPTLANT